VLLTVFFKHDQSRPLNELNAQLDRQGFDKAFPPPGIEVVSWYVMMGIGQVITLRLPASRLREVNRVIEDTAWGAYRTEFYPTYDYKAVGMARTKKPRPIKLRMIFSRANRWPTRPIAPAHCVVRPRAACNSRMPHAPQDWRRRKNFCTEYPNNFRHGAGFKVTRQFMRHDASSPYLRPRYR
jgi:hypothetical protein